MSDAILSAEDVDRIRVAIAADRKMDPLFLKGMRKFCNSHEALRSRLAEVEAERDAAAFDHGNLHADRIAAEARLAEAIELLRGIERAIVDEGPMPAFHQAIMVRQRQEWPTLWTAIDRARAFIEAHGEAPQFPSPGSAPQA